MATFQWPSAAASANPSVGPNGQPIPTSSTLVAGEGPTGLETPISVDASGAVNVVITAGIVDPLPVADALAEASLASLDGKTVTVDTSNVTITSSALPTGAATAALQTSGNASLASIDTKLTAPLSVTGPLTDTQLRASAVPVSLSSVPLPTGAATAANQVTEIASLASIDSKLTAPLSVTGPLTDAQLRASAVPVSAASLPLPTGAATETTLAAMSAKLPATLGQTTSAASLAVVLASNQSSIPVAATPVVPPALTVKSAAITVGTSAVRLTTDGSAPSSTRRVLLANVDTANTAKFYIGPSGVTAATGVILVAGQTFSAEDDAGDYYIISNTAAQTVFVTEQE